MGQLHDNISGLPIIAHNASFERRFLEAELGRIGRRLGNDIYCSMRVARRIFSDAPNHKLGTLVEHAGLRFSVQAHRAMADADVTAKLWFEMEKSVQWNYGLDRVPFGLMAQLQSDRIASTGNFIRDYAERNQIPIVARQRQRHSVIAQRRSKCSTCILPRLAYFIRISSWVAGLHTV